ncbi:MAG: hypothetical protein ACXIUZ_10735, partial [Lysobacteraceae bacterium]
MAQITKRGELQWRARVRVKGFPDQSRTFLYREHAERWARAVERELETSGFIDRREAEKTTLRTVLQRYMREVTPQKKSAEIERVKIGVLLRDPTLPNLKMAAITSAAVAAWRDRRLAQVSSATVIRELGILSAVLNHARREWDIHVENPVRYVKRPPAPRARGGGRGGGGRPAPRGPAPRPRHGPGAARGPIPPARAGPRPRPRSRRRASPPGPR